MGIILKKITGCLLGGAIGDALGMPVVNLTRSEIANLGGVHSFLSSRGVSSISIPLSFIDDSQAGDFLKSGQWTDDTQLALALAETLLEQSGRFVPEAWAHKLVRWLNRDPRSPGLSSLQAAMQLRTGGVSWDEAAHPEGAGCGAATRCAPVALFFRDRPAVMRECVLMQAQVTHGHPDAQAGALAVCEAIVGVLPLRPGDPKESGIEFLERMAFKTKSVSQPFSTCLALARNLLEDKVEPGDAVRALGTSAWSREAIPTALYLIARHLDALKALESGDESEEGVSFESLALESVNLTGGATESIATMVGSIGGALHGVDSIPALWRKEVEDAERILDIAHRIDRNT